MFTNIIGALGITKYPEELEKMYGTPLPVSICNEDNIRALDEKYGLLGKYREKTYECLALVRENDALREYGDLVCSYMAGADRERLAQISLPDIVEDTPLRFYPLLVLLAILPYGIAEFRRRGFSEEEIYTALHPTFVARIELSELMTKKQGLDKAGFGWLRLYATALVFPAGCFNITPKYYKDNFMYIKNVDTGEVLPLALRGVYHKSGNVLGAAGYTDEEGSFEVTFSEDGEAFYAHASVDNRVSPVAKTYKKSEWRAVLREGEGVVGIHIPRGADLSPASVEESFRLAMKLTRERYPEFNAKAIQCFSWMLDPTLADMLGAESKITKFLSRFVKHPRKSDGSGIFTFVFPGKPDSLEELPEKTSLHRKLKAHYLSGGFIHPFGGIVPEFCE